MKFSEKNRERCEAPNGFNHSLNSWSLSDWMTATAGELGEAANIVKKLNRVRDGIPGNVETPEQLRQQLADELADVACYLDLMAQAAGFDLDTIRDEKFAKTSKKIGYTRQKDIDVNGKKFSVSAENITYNDVILLAGYDKDRILSVTWYRGKDNGIVRLGQKIEIDGGEHFSVYDTGSA